MDLYKVIPEHKAHGYTAPAIYFECAKASDSVKQAKEAAQQSGLNRFDCWQFSKIVYVPTKAKIHSKKRSK